MEKTKGLMDVNVALYHFAQVLAKNIETQVRILAFLAVDLFHPQMLPILPRISPIARRRRAIFASRECNVSLSCFHAARREYATTDRGRGTGGQARGGLGNRNGGTMGPQYPEGYNNPEAGFSEEAEGEDMSTERYVDQVSELPLGGGCGGVGDFGGIHTHTHTHTHTHIYIC